MIIILLQHYNICKINFIKIQIQMKINLINIFDKLKKIQY